MGTAFNTSNEIFPPIHFRRVGKSYGRHGRYQRFGQPRIYRQSLRLRLQLLEYLFDVLLQFEVDGGRDCGLVCLRDYHGVYLSARYRFSEEFNRRAEQRVGDDSADFCGACEVQRARRGKAGLLSLEQSLRRNLEVEFGTALAKQLQFDNRERSAVYLVDGVILHCGLRHGRSCERADGSRYRLRSVYRISSGVHEF